MPANPFLAEALFRASRPTFGLGLDIRREEEEEFRLRGERQRGVETKERRRATKSGQGRWLGGVPGGILGFLLGGPAGAAAGAAAGSRLGQELMVRTSPQAMKKFERIGPGVYYVAGGREQQKQFDWAQKERDKYFQEQMWANAATDAFSAYSLTGGKTLLELITGSPGAPAGPSLDTGPLGVSNKYNTWRPPSMP